jgi:hypothetical protein
MYRLWHRVRPRTGDTAQQIIEDSWTQAKSCPIPPTSFKYQPKISIICPICDPRPEDLEALVKSVLQQEYNHWELCFADDACKEEEIITYLQKISNLHSPKVQLTTLPKRSHIVAASNAALAMATGEYIALLDHDDLLTPDALLRVVAQLQSEDPSEVLYSDEIKIDSTGKPIEMHEKPRWSPMYFRSFMYTGHLTVYARSLLERIGGFRDGFDGSQDYELFLRASRVANRIAHVPEKLYLWRSHSNSVAASPTAKPYAFTAAQKGLTANLKSLPLHFPLSVEPGIYPGITSYSTKEPPPEVLPFSATSSVREICVLLRKSNARHICLVRSDCPRPSKHALQRLLAPLAFPDVFCTLPIFTSGWPVERVVSAGYSHSSEGGLANLEGHSVVVGAPGHRLYCPHEVEIAPLHVICGRREELLSLLERSPQSFSNSHVVIPEGSTPVVVPEVRLRASRSLREEAFSIDTFKGISFSVSSSTVFQHSKTEPVTALGSSTR